MTTTLRWSMAGLAALKVIDVWSRGGVWLAAAWAVAALLVLSPARFGPLVLVPLAIVTYHQGLENQHLWLFGWLGLAMTLQRTSLIDDQLLILACKVQVTIVYGFAALAKVNPDFLSGRELRSAVLGGTEAHPSLIWSAVAVAAICTEATLAAGLWSKTIRAQVIVLGLALHASIVVLVSNGSVSLVRLVVFAGLLLALYPSFTDTTREEPIGASIA